MNLEDFKVKDVILLSQNIAFQYNYIPNDTWATGYICICNNKFEFGCSYIVNNPLEELLNAVYQIIPDLAPFPRKEIDCLLSAESIEYRWKFQLVGEKNVSINIYEQSYDVKAELVFKDNCHSDDLVKALVHCIGNNAGLRSNKHIEWVYQHFKLYLKSL